MTNEVLKNVYIITLNSLFNEPAICYANKLNLEIIKDFNPQPKDLYVIFGAHEKSIELLQKQKELNFSFGYIIMNSESQESNSLKNKYYLELMKKNIVFNYSHGVAEYLKTDLNINTFSYFFFEFMKQEAQEEKEYDYLFIGTPTDFRKKEISSLREAFPLKKIYTDFEWSHRSPASMKEILKKSKWVLNIPYYQDDQNLETHRINNAFPVRASLF